MTGAAAPRAPIIEAKGLTKYFGETGTRSSVLRGVDLQIDAGEIVALLGPSGSGKSTLLGILGCLDRPTSGTYRLGGRNVAELGAEARAFVRRSYLGFVFQAFHLVPHATVLENVALPLYYAGLGRAERLERARVLLARVGLSHRARGRPSKLSGGEKQRTAIARALSCSPKLVLADEPTGALDSHTGAEILDLLMELRSRDNLTLLLVTHDPVVAARADRRVYLLDGRITEHGTSEGPNAH